ncbi:MAG: beta-L-arabinofuranosidase domain-containing protein, partial [Bryobacteraceae bacterium]
NAKAYEMMSNLVGLCELYRLTGEPRYLQAALAAQKDIAAHRRYLTGTTSSHEHFRDDFDLPAEQKDDVGEGCATVTWLQLNLQLLRLTGETLYAQELERTVFNQLLAAQDPLTGNICYFTPMDGRKQPTTDINCCRSSEPRGISLIPQLLWGALRALPSAAEPDTVAIEILAPGEALIGGVLVKSQTDYPFDGHVVFTLTPDQLHRFTFALRVPEWAASFRATGPDGKQLAGRPGGYLRLTRDWKRGDRVEVNVELAVRFTPGGKSYPNHVAVERGPLVLALDKGASFDLADISRAALKTVPAPLTQGKPGLYTLPGVVNDSGQTRAVTLHLVPFADAKEYRIWLPLAAAAASGR